ncbi:uncharacterized protein LOC132735954 [Ruditapes philippinarum]|uniref:uncharacterized protein LOC132735954 n=1 Tax=Ruditapes philippinarum TaxID=129788 RepID=UPI00295AD66A|nr:uncharacterized protein LOC132735954 [Ruditapes philippinarum]
MSTSTPISTISSSTLSQVSKAQELSSITSYYMTSTSTALRSRLMPSSSTVLVLSFSRYSDTEPKVSFPTTPLHNNHLQTSELLTTDKTTTFTSSSVSTGRISASAANAISASSSTSLETNHSILQIPPVENTNLVAQNISRNVWVRINDKLLLVVERKESFSNARNICMEMGAELLAYSNPMRFFQPSIDQILTNNSYWLGVYMDKLGMECPLLYNRNNVSSFRLANCSNSNQFICSKSSNVTDEAERLEFEEMLQDMIVKRLDTSKTKRKLVSASDKRASSKSIGAAGILIIILYCVLYVLRI